MRTVLVTGNTACGKFLTYMLRQYKDLCIVNVSNGPDVSSTLSCEYRYRYIYIHNSVTDLKLIEKLCWLYNIHAIIQITTSHINDGTVDNSVYINTKIKDTVIAIDIIHTHN